MSAATQDAADAADFSTGEIFEDLLNETLGETDTFEGQVVKGTIVGLEGDVVVVDVGLKSEGRVPLKEFEIPGEQVSPQVGDRIDIFVERFEDRDGIVRLSREKARREEAWAELELALKKGERVNGVIFGRVKGGFIVDLAGAVAFLPGSQVDIRPVRDISR